MVLLACEAASQRAKRAGRLHDLLKIMKKKIIKDE